MANIHDIRRRIKSIRETRQITKAMKLISAAKLKKARLQLDMALPYFEKVKETIGDILEHSGNISNPYFDLRHEKQAKNRALMVISGDKGLAGSYNHNIIKATEEKLAEMPETVLYVAGYMGKSHFIRNKYKVNMDFDYPVQNPTVFRAREMAETMFNLFKSGEADEVYLLFTQMISSLKVEIQFIKLLPLDLDAFKKDIKPSGNPGNIVEDMIYEPSPKVVFDTLITKYLKGMIYGALVEAFTSEQSARMSAMDNATANADEILHQLSLDYNRARQSAITQEITEIVAGAEVLK